MHLNDAICHHDGIEVVAMHHEQAATFAAEADARVTNRIGVVHVTAGPGGTNTLTGIACAYVDSIPLLVIAGQVTKRTMIGHSGVRQLGMNEVDTAALAQPITKYAITVTEPFMIAHHLSRAVRAAMTDRRGPVFVEIPLDVQAAEINPANLISDRWHEWPQDNATLKKQTDAAMAMLEKAERPLIIFGNGVRLAGACDEFRSVVKRLGIPVVSSWTASDIIDNAHPCYVGRCGIFGDRASNRAVQSADVILIIGSRLSVAQTGHDPAAFAPQARKIMVDVDAAEIYKPTLAVNNGIAVPIVSDAKKFLVELLSRELPVLPCWTHKEPRCEPAASGKGIGAYDFIGALAKRLPGDVVIVTDVGFSFIPAMQTLMLNGKQRLFHSCGVSPMGWAIPAAVGAALAHRGLVICLTGDGGAMMNIQELATIARLRLPIAIFIFANDGYATMRLTQKNHFRRESIAGSQSGLAMPDFVALAEGFGIPSFRLDVLSQFAADLPLWKGPVLCEITMNQAELIAPRIESKTINGRLVPGRLDGRLEELVA